ncbi:hypothetical protein [Limnobacter sp.]|uniref:hypothetical protein n=1 Tax=Limnobacter sp. TaxID=2003368 RepID=UPI0025C3FDF7|nr:hypothetical protein [Limnobacter sp.]
MATHDYVIANGTGAAVRSDLNNALAAIVSNNSGSSEPGTTYAYQWWADTNANVLKIRNSANDGWITLRELDGTMLIEDGSASTPGLAFADDTNTGIFSGGNDQINFATGGAERLKIDGTETVFNNPSNDVDFRVESNGQTHMLYVNAGNDRIGIGHSSPGVTLDVNGSVRSHHTSDSQFLLEVNNVNRGGFSATTDAGVVIYGASSTNPIRFQTAGAEKARIDTSGRLLYGTTSAANLNNASGASAREAKAYIFNNPSTTSERYSFALIGGGNITAGPGLLLNKTRSTSVAHTVVQDGDELGQIRFQGSDGTHYVQGARIEAEVDGTPGTNDMPGRLKFMTSADGASSPTERVRIDSDGRLLVGATSGAGKFIVQDSSLPKIQSNYNGSKHLEFGVGNSGCGFAMTTGHFMTFNHQPFADRGTDNALTERIRLTSAGRLLVGKTSASAANVGSELRDGASDYAGLFVANSHAPVLINRKTTDGVLVVIRQNDTEEGTISVSGSTVSYNGAHLSRWSQLASGAARTEILRGSVLSNLDEMCEWAHAAQDAVLYTEEDELPEGVSVGDVKTPAVDAYTEDNEQLNRMKVSDVEGDVNVAGVFQAWDDDDDTYTNDFYCAMTGDFVIRIAQGTTVARGDLLMSAGDGTAKPQDDDIVRSKTIAKVTSTTVSTTYSDGSYCVPCVLMAC